MQKVKMQKQNKTE